MSVKLEDISVGTRVHYKPTHFGPSQYENGIVKEIRESNPDAVFVVYNCGGEWDSYKEYTSALTNLRDLNLGWEGIDNESAD